MNDQSNAKPVGRIRRILKRIPRGFLGTVLLVLLALTATAPILHLDAFRFGMVLTYAPRTMCIALAFVTALLLFARRCPRRGLTAIATAGVLCWQLGWGSVQGHAANSETLPEADIANLNRRFVLLSFNVHDSTQHAGQLADLCEREKVDVLCLQEVKPPNRQAFFDALHQFDFFLPDESQVFEHSNHGPFSSLIGLRKNRFDMDSVRVETAITQYRTYALNVSFAPASISTVKMSDGDFSPVSNGQLSAKPDNESGDAARSIPTEAAVGQSPFRATRNEPTVQEVNSEQRNPERGYSNSEIKSASNAGNSLPALKHSLWIVNVHTTKAFWAKDEIGGLIAKANMKSDWHFQERDDLDRWLRLNRQYPIVAAGDFNSPLVAHNLRLFDMTHAHLVAGNGVHLTFPRKLPLIGLDHVLGNSRIRFEDYQILDTGFSDHCAQLVRFSVE